jgi:hypothetical protein
METEKWKMEIRQSKGGFRLRRERREESVPEKKMSGGGFLKRLEGEVEIK